MYEKADTLRQHSVTDHHVTKEQAISVPRRSGVPQGSSSSFKARTTVPYLPLRCYTFMAAIRLPVWGCQAQRLEWGLSCKGCENIWDPQREHDVDEPANTYTQESQKMYSWIELFEHLDRCEQSSRLWKAISRTQN